MIKLMLGNNLETLKQLPDNSVDSIVTDPPYGLSFMGKKWDYDVPTTELWQECLRVLKHGGHLLAFFGTRTYHRGVVRIEDAGFEIRDQIQWIYGSGFPKSHDVSKAIDKAAGVEFKAEPASGVGFMNADKEDGYNITKNKLTKIGESTQSAKQWDGWGTALKPANEPIVVARKPLEKGLTIAENVLKYGTGAINIDECRIGDFENKTPSGLQRYRDWSDSHTGQDRPEKEATLNQAQGRWPANVILDEVTGCADWSRFFYVAKASKSERNKGLDSFEQIVITNKCKEENTVAVQLLQKVTSESMVKWSTGECGKNLTALFHKECKSIIKTETNKIIESKILNALMLSLTKESTQDVLTGSNHAESVENLKKFLLIITNEKTELALGAANVALKMLQSINENESSKDFSNFHSTVKPIKLMQYLIKLVTPPNGTVLDPFMGSGSTGVAAKELGFNFVGCELSPDYFEIAEKRIEDLND